MPTYISLLRGVNVSGHRPVPMAKLKALYEALGFERVRTYLQSGNVVFDGKKASPAGHATALEKRIVKEFGFEVPVIVKTVEGWARIVAANPFLKKPGQDPKFMYVTILAESRAPAALDGMKLPILPGDGVVLKDGVVYLYLPSGYGRTKLNNNYFERALGVIATTRNWNTMIALEQMGRE